MIQKIGTTSLNIPTDKKCYAFELFYNSDGKMFFVIAEDRMSPLVRSWIVDSETGKSEKRYFEGRGGEFNVNVIRDCEDMRCLVIAVGSFLLTVYYDEDFRVDREIFCNSVFNSTFCLYQEHNVVFMEEEDETCINFFDLKEKEMIGSLNLDSFMTISMKNFDGFNDFLLVDCTSGLGGPKVCLVDCRTRTKICELKSDGEDINSLRVYVRHVFADYSGEYSFIHNKQTQSGMSQDYYKYPKDSNDEFIGTPEITQLFQSDLNKDKRKFEAFYGYGKKFILGLSQQLDQSFSLSVRGGKTLKKQSTIQYRSKNETVEILSLEDRLFSIYNGVRIRNQGKDIFILYDSAEKEPDQYDRGFRLTTEEKQEKHELKIVHLVNKDILDLEIDPDEKERIEYIRYTLLDAESEESVVEKLRICISGIDVFLSFKFLFV